MIWHPQLVWYTDSPDAGDLACLCSWCGLGITADVSAVRLWWDGRELRFHDACFGWVCTQEWLLAADLDRGLDRLTV